MIRRFLIYLVLSVYIFSLPAKYMYFMLLRIFVDVTMSSCTPCPNCNSLIYDEDIIAGWVVDDANMNTRCPVCANNFLAYLKVSIRNKPNDLGSTSWYSPLSICIQVPDEDEVGGSSFGTREAKVSKLLKIFFYLIEFE